MGGTHLQLALFAASAGAELLLDCFSLAAAGGPRKSVLDIFTSTGAFKLDHGYHRYYERELAPYRDLRGLRILEIGVKEGRSLRAWLEYFSYPAAVQGISLWADSDMAREEACRFVAPRCCVVRIHNMDQSNETALRALRHLEPAGWDIVIDDGSHVPSHQVLSFKYLFPQVRPGGLYVIEDLETSYAESGWQFIYWLSGGGVGRRGPGNAIERFKDLVDVMMRARFRHPNFTMMGRHVDKDIVRISFGDGLLFVEKRPRGADWVPARYPRGMKFRKRHFAASVQERTARARVEYGSQFEERVPDEDLP